MSRKSKVWMIDVDKARGRTEVSFCRPRVCDRTYTPSNTLLSHIRRIAEHKDAKVEYMFTHHIIGVGINTENLQGRLLSEEK